MLRAMKLPPVWELPVGLAQGNAPGKPIMCMENLFSSQKQVKECPIAHAKIRKIFVDIVIFFVFLRYIGRERS